MVKTIELEVELIKFAVLLLDFESLPPQTGLVASKVELTLDLLLLDEHVDVRGRAL